MIDLSTTYLGLQLDNPFVPSSSPLTKELDLAKRMEDAGASAIVMHSLFEEETHREEARLDRLIQQQSVGHSEAANFIPMPEHYHSGVDEHLEQLHRLKASLDIPVIASLNGISMDGWLRHGKELQQAGADALELNVYYVAADVDEPSASVEQRYIDLLTELRSQVQIPITMKLPSMFSSIGNMVKRFEQAGANGVSLFNRFYQPNIDPERMAINHTLELSASHESLLRVRWIAILYSKVNLSLAVTGGIHTAQDALKALLAGADVTHMCSVLLQHGPEVIGRIRQEMLHWLQQHEYESVAQLKGSMSQQHAPNPVDYERAGYVDIIDKYARLVDL